MNKRSLALKLGVVGVVAAAGVGIAATPASAMEKECFIAAYWSHRAAIMLQDTTLTGEQWLGWFELWNRAEVRLEDC
jgi:hypothetical protein